LTRKVFTFLTFFAPTLLDVQPYQPFALPGNLLPSSINGWVPLTNNGGEFWAWGRCYQTAGPFPLREDPLLLLYQEAGVAYRPPDKLKRKFFGRNIYTNSTKNDSPVPRRRRPKPISLSREGTPASGRSARQSSHPVPALPGERMSHLSVTKGTASPPKKEFFSRAIPDH